MSPRVAKLLRLVSAASLLALTLYLVDPEQVAQRIVHLRIEWVLAGLMLSVPNTLLLALRWWYVAKRLDAPLSPRRAVADYYLAGFANQALPTGLAGAALRAVRHGKRVGGNSYGKTLAAVILERLAGLAVLALFALAACVYVAKKNTMLAVVAGGTVLGLMLVSVLVFVLAARRSTLGRDGFTVRARHALVADRAWLHHLVISSTSVVLLCLGFFCAAQASGVSVSLVQTLVVTPLILSSMVIPLSVAGWGIREASSAALFAVMGLHASDGVAVSVSFGLISLVASLPGALVWLAPDENT